MRTEKLSAWEIVVIQEAVAEMIKASKVNTEHGNILLTKLNKATDIKLIRRIKKGKNTE